MVVAVSSSTSFFFSSQPLSLPVNNTIWREKNPQESVLCLSKNRNSQLDDVVDICFSLKI